MKAMKALKAMKAMKQAQKAASAPAVPKAMKAMKAMKQANKRDQSTAVISQILGWITENKCCTIYKGACLVCRSDLQNKTRNT